MKARGVFLGGALLLASCSAHQARPSGPPPEYEEPKLTPWDAGTPVDPLDAAERTSEPVPEPAAGPDGGPAHAEDALSPGH